jgi:hypothetical protein
VLPSFNGQRLLSRPGSKSAYETKRSRRSGQKKNSVLGTVADGFQRTSPHLRCDSGSIKSIVRLILKRVEEK